MSIGRFVDVAVKDPKKIYKRGPGDVFTDRRLSDSERLTVLTAWNAQHKGDPEVQEALERARSGLPAPKRDRRVPY